MIKEIAAAKSYDFVPHLKEKGYMESRLYVGNLPYATTEADLVRFFAQAGEVKQVVLIMDRETRRPKGFGFVEMATDAEAQKAVALFNKYQLDGRQIVVTIARPRAERPKDEKHYRNELGDYGDRKRRDYRPRR